MLPSTNDQDHIWHIGIVQPYSCKRFFSPDFLRSSLPVDKASFSDISDLTVSQVESNNRMLGKIATHRALHFDTGPIPRLDLSGPQGASILSWVRISLETRRLFQATGLPAC
jgi:hypothetical protein